jgi:hypothetical protein
MRTKVLLGLAVAVMLIVSVATIGSNMGFKISIPLVAGGTGHTGLNWVALPYYCGYATASNLVADLPANSEVDWYNETDGTYLQYDGIVFYDDFDIAPSGTLKNRAGILIKPGASANWIVVGSHNPSVTVPLVPGGTGHTGLNWVAVPYHSTKTTASGLIAELPANTEIDKYVETNGTYLQYDGLVFYDDFSLTPGTAILVKPGASASWLPAHY